MKKILCSLMLASLTITGCSSSSSGGGATTVSNLVTQTYSAVNAQAAKAAGDIQYEAFSPVTSISPMAAASSPNFNDAWSVTGVLNNSVTNSGMVPVQTFMAMQLTPGLVNNDNSSINVFGRINTALKIFCAVGVALGMQGVTMDSSGYPPVGDNTVTFSASVKAQMTTQCAMDVSDIPNNESMILTVATSSGDYDRKFSFNTFNQDYYVRSNATAINIATVEVQDSGHTSRTIVEWNRVTNVLLAEYVSVPVTNPDPAGVYGYRFYYDETNDIGQILTYEGPDSSFNDGVRYILAGKPETGTGFSISLKNGNISSGGHLEGCILFSTFALLPDGARCTPSSSMLAGADIDASNSMLSTFHGTQGSTSWQTSSASLGLTWSTTSDMLTTAIAP